MKSSKETTASQPIGYQISLLGIFEPIPIMHDLLESTFSAKNARYIVTVFVSQIIGVVGCATTDQYTRGPRYRILPDQSFLYTRVIP